jgi:hypothetical protein
MIRHARNLGLAFALSTAALVVALVVALALQALLLVRNPFARAVNGNPTGFRCLSICNDGRAALMLVREPGVMNKDEIHYSVALFSTIGNPTRLRLPTRGLTPWRTTSANHGPFGFLATTAGDLYALDLAARSVPVQLGQHQEEFPDVLECTDDGALLVAAGCDGISCWDRAAARCLWRRSDIGLHGGKFVPGTARFVAALSTGPILELSACSGSTLRKLPNHCGSIVRLDIAPDSRRLAAIDLDGICTVSALDTGEPLWSRRFPVYPVTPRFSPDGSILVTANQQRLPRVSLLSAASGNLLDELTGAQAEIVGLAVTPQGAVYAWDLSGTITVWDLASCTLLFQFHPEPST